MPDYSAAALLSDAHLRLDGLGQEYGILVVEGPDDKRLFYGRVRDPRQIVIASGRTLLLAAYSQAASIDRRRIIFFTDCDYEVRQGNLRGGEGLVITAGTNVESDLLELNALALIITEIAPSAIADEQVQRIADKVLEKAKSVSLPIGRMRMAAQPLGVDLSFDDLELSKYWDKRGHSFKEAKLLDVLEVKIKQAGHGVDWKGLVEATPTDEGMCNGKDTLRAARFLLHHYYKVPNHITDNLVQMMVRMSLDDSAFRQWSVVKRIQAWEGRTGRLVLR
ncbi:hypothetical protein KBX71_08950 [Micromonospora sp. D93]|uniref:hypothetical protein n=1 Tax=Micromonospora sp. D93 TaxID=2824886 RepID=UPI001B370D2A|nr:hypothetical protein [Micromonospora sp. D93]MBQ1017992.1 hypothetical protein [Micromonospora sp. D93]